jgi:hypothetical protein
VKFDTGISAKICPENPDLVKVEQKISGTLHEGQCMFHIFGNDIILVQQYKERIVALP